MSSHPIRTRRNNLQRTGREVPSLALPSICDLHLRHSYGSVTLGSRSPREFMFNLKILLALCVVIAIANIGLEERSLAQAPTKPSSSMPSVSLDKGTVDGNVYKNASLGLELSVAPALKSGGPVLHGKPGSVPLLVTVAAEGDGRFFSTSDSTTFYADALAYYPDNRRST